MRSGGILKFPRNHISGRPFVCDSFVRVSPRIPRGESQMTSLALLLFPAVSQQSPCEGLKSLSLPNTTITASDYVPAGQQRGRGATGTQLPAHCRIAATLKPSSDSNIEMELWMP